MDKPLTPESAFKLLSDAMSDISETLWCAGWLQNTEWILWEMMRDKNASRDWGLGKVTEAEIDTLRELSQIAGKWPIGGWDKKWNQQSVPLDAADTLCNQWREHQNEKRVIAMIGKEASDG